MNVKTDTKEKFTVITPLEAEISANMADELNSIVEETMQVDPFNVILKFSMVTDADEHLIDVLLSLQEKFLTEDKSFVQCEFKEKLKDKLSAHDAADILNNTPTESEAWDIVQMEEIERELFNGE